MSPPAFVGVLRIDLEYDSTFLASITAHGNLLSRKTKLYITSSNRIPLSLALTLPQTRQGIIQIIFNTFDRAQYFILSTSSSQISCLYDITDIRHCTYVVLRNFTAKPAPIHQLKYLQSFTFMDVALSYLRQSTPSETTSQS